MSKSLHAMTCGKQNKPSAIFRGFERGQRDATENMWQVYDGTICDSSWRRRSGDVLQIGSNRQRPHDSIGERLLHRPEFQVRPGRELHLDPLAGGIRRTSAFLPPLSAAIPIAGAMEQSSAVIRRLDDVFGTDVSPNSPAVLSARCRKSPGRQRTELKKVRGRLNRPMLETPVNLHFPARSQTTRLAFNLTQTQTTGSPSKLRQTDFARWAVAKSRHEDVVSTELDTRRSPSVKQHPRHPTRSRCNNAPSISKTLGTNI